MTKNIWQDIEKQLNKIKSVLDKSLYKKNGEGSLTDAELTELIMMSGYLHHLIKDRGGKIEKEDLKKIDSIRVRCEEIEKGSL